MKHQTIALTAAVLVGGLGVGFAQIGDAGSARIAGGQDIQPRTADRGSATAYRNANVGIQRPERPSQPTPLQQGGDKIDRGLELVFEGAQEGEIISALVYLQHQADIHGMIADFNANGATRTERNFTVVSTLQDIAEATQPNLLAELDQLMDAGLVEEYESFWIVNMIRVDSTEPIIRQIADRADVQRVYHNIGVETIEPVEVRPDNHAEPGPLGGSPDSPEPGVVAVRAPEVWAMGYTGDGILIATIDTGVYGLHQALDSRWRGHDPQYVGNPQWAWWDPTGNTQTPMQFTSGSSHGTHVTGTVCGGPPGDQVGVAPGAQWIHAAALQGSLQDQISQLVGAFQWMAAPTGNAGDSWAVPHTCSNSWGLLSSHGYPPCDELYWQWIDASEAAGTSHFFSAGNEGTSGLRRPADRATNEYFSSAVAAVNGNDPNWPLASFSSQGPTNCTPSGDPAIKPEISAPGVNVRSSVVGGGYSTMSGTSMASPHINGVAALMLEACEALTNDQIKQIIYDTAVDLGTPGKNNQYGWGMVDAVEAVNLALGMCTISISLPQGAPNLLDPGETETFPVRIIEGQESIVPGTEKLFYRYDGGSYQSVQLVHVGGETYEATLPAPNCDSEPEFYVEVQGDGGSVARSPLNAPDTVYTALVGEFETIEVFYRDFAGGLPSGWSQTGIWKVTNACPVGTQDCSPGPQYAYYGVTTNNQCTFNTGGANSGEMLSELITFPNVAPGEKITVSFCYNLETENHPSYDIARFMVQGTGIEQRMAEAPTWRTFSIDVTPLAGETRRLRWHFDTIDGFFNNFRGWQVDKVRIEVTSLVCEDDTCPWDFDGDGVVDGADLGQFLANWGPCDDCNDCWCDFNNSCECDGANLGQLLANWGACP